MRASLSAGCAGPTLACSLTASPCPTRLQVYVQPALLGWRPVLLSWLNTLPSPGMSAAHKTLITSLFDWLVPPMLRVALKQVGVCGSIGVCA